MKKALASANRRFGYYGTMLQNNPSLTPKEADGHFSATASGLMKDHGLTDSEAVEFLDSSHGRHLADSMHTTDSSSPTAFPKWTGQQVKIWQKSRKAFKSLGSDRYSLGAFVDLSARKVRKAFKPFKKVSAIGLLQERALLKALTPRDVDATIPKLMGTEENDMSEHEAHAAKFSPEQKNAIRKWSGTGYVKINDALRSGKTVPSDHAETVKHLDAITSAKHSTPITTNTHFGSDVAKALEQHGEGSDKGFISTSLNEHGPLNQAPTGYVRAKVTTSQGAYIGPHSIYKGEKEFLLPKGSKFRLDKVEGEGHDRILHVTHLGGGEGSAAATPTKKSMGGPTTSTFSDRFVRAAKSAGLEDSHLTHATQFKDTNDVGDHEPWIARQLSNHFYEQGDAATGRKWQTVHENLSPSRRMF